MSRTGPRSPASTARATAALCAASPPRRSDTDAGARPSAAGENSVLATSPSCTTHIEDGPVVVSSSSPSEPWKTRAEHPRPASTPAMTPPICGSNTPTAWAEGRAGLATGPRKLNTVGTPSSLRVGPACRSDGWYSGANRNATPSSSASSAVAAGGRSMTTPSASSTSAAPHADDAARLPCLTIRTPAAAATIVPMVDTLTVRAPSPPVPTRSVRRPVTWIGVACVSMARASPVISATDVPLIRSATPNPAIWEGVAAPSMISFMAHSLSSAVSESPRISAPSSAGHVVRASMAAPWVGEGGEDGVGLGRRWSGLGGERWGGLEGPGWSDSARYGALPHQAGQFMGQRDRVDGVADHGVSARPGGEPAIVGAADDQQHRRAVVDLVLGLAAHAHPAGRLGLPVEHHHLGATRVEQPEQGRLGGNLDDFRVRHVHRGATSDREPDLGPDIGVVAVHNDLHDRHGIEAYTDAGGRVAIAYRLS